MFNFGGRHFDSNEYWRDRFWNAVETGSMGFEAAVEAKRKAFDLGDRDAEMGWLEFVTRFALSRIRFTKYSAALLQRAVFHATEIEGANLETLSNLMQHRGGLGRVTRPASLPFVSPHYPAVIKHFAPLPLQLHALRQIFSISRDLGVKVFFVAHPNEEKFVNETNSTYNSQQGRVVRGLLTDGDNVTFLSPGEAWSIEFFDDAIHLNKAGMMRFTQWLISQRVCDL